MVHFKLGRMEAAYTDFSEALVKIDESMKEKRTLTEIIAIRKAMIQSASTSSGTSGNVGLMTSSPRGVNKIAEALQKSKGLKAAKQRCQCLVNRAMVLIRAGSSKQAEQDLIAAIGLGDYHNFATPLALHDLATIKIRNEKTSAALELLDRAIQIPGHHVPQARMNRGVALCSTSPPNLAKAMEDFNAAVAAYPSNVHGLYNRAICLGMSGHLRAAEEDLMRAIAIAPGDSMLYDQRGKTMAAMGRPKVALKDYATAMLLE
jgi:tetratricopeptide (TPR) repeat protein